MSETVHSCPLCVDSVFTVFDQRSSHGHRITNVMCRHCGLVFQSPRMTESEADGFYRSEYRLLYQGDEGPNLKDMAVQQARAGGLLKFIQPKVKEISRHLDIGCSAGLLLKRFQEFYGCQAIGIEPGDAYRAYAGGQGLSVYAYLADLPQTNGLAYDLVSLVHVLEHLPDPVMYLENLRQKYLTGKGYLLLEVPNLYGHDCFEVAHMVSYSPHTLSQVVRKAGFQPVALVKHGMPRSRLIPLYITLLAKVSGDQTSPTTVVPEKLVDLRRRWGMFFRALVTRLLPGKAWLPYPKMDGNL